MKMDVEYRLTSPGVIIVDYPEAIIGYASVARQLCGNKKYLPHKLAVNPLEVQTIDNVSAWNEQ
jgi:hypothetical protein